MHRASLVFATTMGLLGCGPLPDDEVEVDESQQAVLDPTGERYSRCRTGPATVNFDSDDDLRVVAEGGEGDNVQRWSGDWSYRVPIGGMESQTTVRVSYSADYTFHIGGALFVGEVGVGSRLIVMRGDTEVCRVDRTVDSASVPLFGETEKICGLYGGRDGDCAPRAQTVECTFVADVASPPGDPNLTVRFSSHAWFEGYSGTGNGYAEIANHLDLPGNSVTAPTVCIQPNAITNGSGRCLSASTTPVSLNSLARFVGCDSSDDEAWARDNTTRQIRSQQSTTLCLAPLADRIFENNLLTYQTCDTSKISQRFDILSNRQLRTVGLDESASPRRLCVDSTTPTTIKLKACSTASPLPAGQQFAIHN